MKVLLFSWPDDPEPPLDIWLERDDDIVTLIQGEDRITLPIEYWNTVLQLLPLYELPFERQAGKQAPVSRSAKGANYGNAPA